MRRKGLAVKHGGAGSLATRSITRRLDFAMQAKALDADDEPGSFEGYAAVFGNVDQGGDVIEPGAFTKALAQAQTDRRLIPMLWQHDPAEPVGVWVELREDDNGLFVKGRLLVEDDPVARRAYAHLKAGSIGGMSIGYRTIDGEADQARRGVFRLKELDLREVSLVTMPMNLEARASAVKNVIAAGDMPTAREFETLLRDACGFSKRKAVALTAACAPILRGEPAGVPGESGSFLSAIADAIERG